MERIAQCVALSAADAENTKAASLLATALEGMAPEELPGSDIADENWFQIFAPFDFGQLVSFLSLTELAVRASYVDLAQWDDTPLLERVVRRWAELTEGWTERSHTALLHALLARFDGGDLRLPARADTAFHAFESYLHLTRNVARDVQLRGVAAHLHNDWKPGDDEAALLSPSAFADAMTLHRVGEAQTQDIAGMVRLLQALESLIQIVHHLHEHDALQTGICAHARWSHGAWVVLMRTDEWARSMSEWTSPRDRDGEKRWIEFRTNVLVPFMYTQILFGFDQSTNASLERPLDTPRFAGWSQQVPLSDVASRVDDLIAEGRVERARRVLHNALGTLSGRASTGDADERSTTVELLVSHAQKLAALGDLTSAAAYVAPFAPYLVKDVGRAYAVTADALELLARARRAPEAVVAPEPIQMPNVLPSLLSRPQPEPRYRSLGEDA